MVAEKTREKKKKRKENGKDQDEGAGDYFGYFLRNHPYITDTHKHTHTPPKQTITALHYYQ